MTQPLWQTILLSDPSTNDLWELFHENSKNRHYQHAISEKDMIEHTNHLHEALPFEGYPIMKLPNALPSLECHLSKAITTRRSALSMIAGTISLEILTTLLHHAYGITQNNIEPALHRPFRAVPSAGALHPLEIFFYSAHVETLPRGLYHYNPSMNHLRLVQRDVKVSKVAGGFIQSDIVFNASLILFIAAIFERTVFKYGDRGYRYTLLEAGHVGQNICLVANALNLACLTLGGFLDDRIDDLLGLDGIRQSTIYAIGIGRNGECESGKETSYEPK